MNALRIPAAILATAFAACENAPGDTIAARETGEAQAAPLDVSFLELDRRIVLRPGAGQLIGEVADIAANDTAIWVADRIEADVKVFDWHGTQRGSLGRPGDGPGEFRAPFSLALLRGGGIAVLDLVRMRVSTWNHAGEEMMSWPHRMLVATSLAVTPDQRLLLLGITGTGTDARVVPIMDVAGNVLQRHGAAPPITRPREGSMRVYVGDQVGRSVLYTHSATNEVWELGPEEVRSYRVAADAFREWTWHDQPQGPGSSLHGWLGEPTWMTKLFAVGDKHFVAAVGEPVISERRYRYRYALVAVGGDEIEMSSLTDVELFGGMPGRAFGVHALDDGSVELSIYHVRLPAAPAGRDRP